MESVVEDLRRHGILVQDDSGRRLASKLNAKSIRQLRSSLYLLC